MLSFGAVGFVLFGYLIIAAWSNAVNLTDGLDGLAAGTSAMVLATYVIIGFWQFRNNCALSVGRRLLPGARPARRRRWSPPPRWAAASASCGGTPRPARIFMGDTGSLALGGLVAGLSIVTRTELLLVVIGGVFVVEALSVRVQIAVFRTTRRRVFRMAPVPPPLRAGRLGRDHGDHPVLAARGHVRGARAWGCSTASGSPRRRAAER